MERRSVHFEQLLPGKVPDLPSKAVIAIWKIFGLDYYVFGFQWQANSLWQLKNYRDLLVD